MTVQQPAKGWEHMAAGAAAGSLAVLLLHPFDVVKTRLQVQDGFHVGQDLVAYRNTMHAVVAMYRTEGWRAFYGGLAPAWIGAGVAWGAYFYVYEAIKKYHCQSQQTDRLGPGWHLISAAQAGAMVGVITNPIWLVKTRLQIQRQLPHVPRPLTAAGGGAAGAVGAAKPYRGFVDALVRIGREDGWRGYYKGLGPSLFLQTTHGAIQFTVYEELKRVCSRFGLDSGPNGLAASPATSSHATGGGKPHTSEPASTSGGSGRASGTAAAGPPASHDVADPAGHSGRAGRGAALRGGSASAEPDRQLGSFELSLCAVVSKLSAAITTYPSQVVRSRLQQRADGGRAHVYRNAWEVIQLTWRREGARGFYKGLGPALLRVMPQSAITLVAYENILRLLTERDSRQVP